MFEMLFDVLGILLGVAVFALAGWGMLTSESDREY